MFWLRPPVVAGRFYPKEEAKLLGFLEEVCTPAAKKQKALAIMAPHAGYIYSGQVAGDVYRQTEIPENVFILCPNHTGKGPRVSVWSEGAWETPLGRIPVAEDLAKKLMDTLSLKDGDMLAHIYEHAIEVHLPFLQIAQKNLRIIPIVLGHLRLENCIEVGKALATVIEQAGREKCLIVASSDMSHYIPADVAKILDQKALDQVKKLSPVGLFNTVAENGISMCGVIPMTATLEAVTLMGGKKSELISYAHSGDVTGDMKSVVGYANALFPA